MQISLVLKIFTPLFSNKQTKQNKKLISNNNQNNPKKSGDSIDTQVSIFILTKCIVQSSTQTQLATPERRTQCYYSGHQRFSWPVVLYAHIPSTTYQKQYKICIKTVHLTLFTMGEIFIIFSIFSDICYFPKYMENKIGIFESHIARL